MQILFDLAWTNAFYLTYSVDDFRSSVQTNKTMLMYKRSEHFYIIKNCSLYRGIFFPEVSFFTLEIYIRHVSHWWN